MVPPSANRLIRIIHPCVNTTQEGLSVCIIAYQMGGFNVISVVALVQ